MTKVCTSCLIPRPFCEFHKQKDKLDGLRSQCKACRKRLSAEFYKANRDRILMQTSIYAQKNKEKVNQKASRWRKKNPHKVKQILARYATAHPEQMRAKCAAFKAKNPDYFHNYVVTHRKEYNAKSAARRALKLQQTPPWADLDAIKRIYINCPSGYVVDHVIPLKGKSVSGLHIAANLQYLKPIENQQKSNKWPYCVPSEDR